jgi:hypothetical protein
MVEADGSGGNLTVENDPKPGFVSSSIASCCEYKAPAGIGAELSSCVTLQSICLQQPLTAVHEIVPLCSQACDADWLDPAGAILTWCSIVRSCRFCQLLLLQTYCLAGV